MSTNENTEVPAAEDAATYADIERDALISQAREFVQVDTSRLAKNTFQPTMFFREKGYPAPRAVFFPELTGDPHDRDKIAWATTLLSATIDDLHSITWVTDSYGATQPKKTDGSEWGYGEMQKAVQEQTEDAHLIFEQVNYQTMEVMADGTLRSSMICFKYARNGDTVDVDWDNPVVMIDGEDGSLQGFYVDAMTNAFETPKLRAEMVKFFGADTGAALGLSEDAQKVHALCAAIKMIAQQIQMPVLIPVRNDEEQDILKRSFEEGPQFGPHRIEMFDQDQVELIGQLEEQYNLDSTMYRDALKKED